MDKLKNTSAAADKTKAKNDSEMKALQTQIDSQAARIQQLLEVISDREDKLEVANRETKKSVDDSASKGREATMEIDTLKGELDNCHNNCDSLTDDLKVFHCILYRRNNPLMYSFILLYIYLYMYIYICYSYTT